MVEAEALEVPFERSIKGLAAWLCCLDPKACEDGATAAGIYDEVIELVLELIGIGIAVKVADELADLLKRLLRTLPDIPGNNRRRKQVIEILECLLSISYSVSLHHCFPAGTPVLTPFGHRAIEEIRPGYHVRSRNILTGEWVDAVVAHTFSREHAGEIVTLEVAGESITATSKHPFWVQGGHELDQRAIPDQAELGESTAIPGRWIAAEDLEPGDLLATPIGPIAIVSVVHAQTTLTVYNLHVPKTQTYTVGNWGVWVHNDSDPLRKPCDGLAPNRQTVPKSPTQALDEIAEFKKKQGLPEYSQSPGTTGTVARVELEGTPYYGRNSKLPGYGLSLETRRSWFDVLKGKGKLQGLDNLGDAQFLSHAETQALLNAYKAKGKLPDKVVLVVDRPTCPNCQKYLGDLAGELGVMEIEIHWKNQASGPLTIKAN